MLWDGQTDRQENDPIWGPFFILEYRTLKVIKYLLETLFFYPNCGLLTKTGGVPKKYL